jgi:hypothetical protein
MVEYKNAGEAKQIESVQPRWEHLRSRSDSHRAEPGFSTPRTGGPSGIRRVAQIDAPVIGIPQVRLKPDTTYAQ